MIIIESTWPGPERNWFYQLWSKSMPYTIVDDDGTLQVRASLDTVEQLDELVETLQRKAEKLGWRQADGREAGK